MANRFGQDLHLKPQLLHGLHHPFCVDLVPQDPVPIREGLADQHDHVPQCLQMHEVVHALPDGQVIRHGHVEEQLEVVELVRTSSNLARPLVELVDRVVAQIVVAADGVVAPVRALHQEFGTERLHVLAEAFDLGADLDHLLALQGQDLLLDVECGPNDLRPLSRGLLELREALVGDLNAVLLQEEHLVADRLEELAHRVHGELHVADVGHRGVEQALVVGVVCRARRPQAYLHAVDEPDKRCDSLVDKGLEESRELLLPLFGEVDKCDLHRLGVDSQPVDIGGRLQARQVLLHLLESRDLDIEAL
mmetsp:Transcript_4522/g.13088  ORF Transcript_4522/g.13088 Transcript_4522/m.13088 type:complete len:306 (-) Transcript_4522:972-1889(-)